MAIVVGFLEPIRLITGVSELAERFRQKVDGQRLRKLAKSLAVE